MERVDLNLGHDHTLSWLIAGRGSDERVGAVIGHPAPGKTETGYCEGFVSWAPTTWERENPDKLSDAERNRPRWTLHGAADAHLTLTPSVLCATCGDHGFVTDGRWIPA